MNGTIQMLVENGKFPEVQIMNNAGTDKVCTNSTSWFIHAKWSKSITESRELNSITLDIHPGGLISGK